MAGLTVCVYVAFTASAKHKKQVSSDAVMAYFSTLTNLFWIQAQSNIADNSERCPCALLIVDVSTSF